jgi:hypothetical protein
MSQAQQKMEAEFGRKAAPGKILVRNLMSNKVVEIDENTPHCCRVDSERYWSM